MGQQPNDALELQEEEQPFEEKKHKKHKKHKKNKDHLGLLPSQSVNYSESQSPEQKKLSKSRYEKEITCLQTELVKMQYWIKHTGYRLGFLTPI